MASIYDCLQALRNGSVDISLGVKIRDNPGFLETIEISSANLHMVISNKFFKESGGRKLKNYAVAFENNTGNYSLMHNLGASMYLVVATQEEVLEKFKQGKADAILLNEDSINYLEQKGDISNQFVLLYKYIDTVSYVILVSEENHSLLRKLNDGIVNLKVTREYEKIRNKWVPDIEAYKFQELLKKVIYFSLIFLVAFGCYLYINRRFTTLLKKEVAEKTEKLKLANYELEQNIVRLQTQNDLRNIIIQNSPDGIVLVGEDWRIRLINRNACILAGVGDWVYDKDIFNIHVFSEILKPIKDKVFIKGHNYNNQRIEIEIKANDRKSYRYDIHQVIEYEKVIGILISVKDITYEEIKKKEIFEKEKNEALNRMIAGIAHEIKNPLTSIFTFASMINEKGMDKEFQTAFAEFVPNEVERINKLIESLINYAKPVRGNTELFDVIEAIRECLYLTKIAIKEGKIRLNTKLESGLIIKANKNQIKQVLINVIMNGIEAIEKKFSTSRIEILKPAFMEITAYSENEYVIIDVYDEGVGMDDAEQRKYSEPFFTTKSKGTGLGMAMAIQYIKENGGMLRIQSEKNKYTRIKILFRRYDHEAKNNDN